MDHPMHIPWTRTNKLRTAKPATEKSEDLFQRLTEFLVKTLTPFPEAREALCLAVMNFDPNQSHEFKSLGQAFDASYFARHSLDFTPDDNQKRVLQSSAIASSSTARASGASPPSAASKRCTSPSASRNSRHRRRTSERQTGEFLRKMHDLLHALDIKPRRDGYNRTHFSCPTARESSVCPARLHKTIRGFSALSLLIFDEAAQVPDELYVALRPMLATTNGALWLLSTPYGKQGFFYNEWARGGDAGNASRSPQGNARASRPNFSTKSVKSSATSTSPRNTCVSSTPRTTRSSTKPPSLGRITGHPAAAPGRLLRGTPMQSRTLHRPRPRPASRPDRHSCHRALCPHRRPPRSDHLGTRAHHPPRSKASRNPALGTPYTAVTRAH